VAGLIIVGLASNSQAQKLNEILGGILYPNDARRYEDQARRNGRPDEERYWHNYGVGLQGQRHHMDVQRHEEDARRHGRPDEERYWHNYDEGLRQQGYR
jgi:hypothetical protein